MKLLIEKFTQVSLVLGDQALRVVENMSQVNIIEQCNFLKTKVVQFINVVKNNCIHVSKGEV